MADIKQVAEWMLEGHLVKRKSKQFLIHYDYNKPEEEFNLTIDDLRSTDWEIHKRKFSPVVFTTDRAFAAICVVRRSSPDVYRAASDTANYSASSGNYVTVVSRLRNLLATFWANIITFFRLLRS